MHKNESSLYDTISFASQKVKVLNESSIITFFKSWNILSVWIVSKPSILNLNKHRVRNNEH